MLLGKYSSRRLIHVGVVRVQVRGQEQEQATLATGAGTVVRRMRRRVSSACWPCLASSNRNRNREGVLVEVLAEGVGIAKQSPVAARSSYHTIPYLIMPYRMPSALSECSVLLPLLLDRIGHDRKRKMDLVSGQIAIEPS